MRLSTILTLLTIHIIYASAFMCGSTSCSSTSGCCNDYATGYRCFDPKYYHCVRNDMNQTVLCGLKGKACGTACYNPAMYTCTEGEILCGTMSDNVVVKSCAGQCYSSAKFDCCLGKLVAKGTAGKCSPIPANSTTLFCSPFNQTVCPEGHSCCDGTCYDPASRVCFDNQLCPLGNKVCGGDCYDPTTKECCNNELFAKGQSVCSTAKATCCSCSCKSNVISGISGLFTVASPAQCNATYVQSQYGDQLDCPASTFRSCNSNSSCRNSIDCGSSQLFLERCYGYTDSCEGTYLCGGGSYKCSIKSRSACPGPVSEPYESGHNVTLTSPGTTQYEVVPPNFAGKVCCWCSSDQPVATSAIVPSYGDCNPTYVAANDYYDYPNTVCSVWSRSFYDTNGLACGLPSE